MSMKLVGTFQIPGGTGNTGSTLEKPYSGVAAHTDEEYRKYVERNGNLWQTLSFTISVYLKDPNVAIDEPTLGQMEASGDQLCALHEWLHTEEGSALLKIEDGDEETNLAVAFDRANNKVLFIEHELEDGKDEEVHLHARPPLRLKNDEALIVIFE